MMSPRLFLMLGIAFFLGSQPSARTCADDANHGKKGKPEVAAGEEKRSPHTTCLTPPSRGLSRSRPPVEATVG